MRKDGILHSGTAAFRTMQREKKPPEDILPVREVPEPGRDSVDQAVVQDLADVGSDMSDTAQESSAAVLPEIQSTIALTDATVRLRPRATGALLVGDQSRERPMPPDQKPPVVGFVAKITSAKKKKPKKKRRVVVLARIPTSPKSSVC